MSTQEQGLSLFAGMPSAKNVVAEFTVPGEPVSKSRARFTKRGSKVHAYTPEKTHAAEEQVAWRFKAAGGRLTKDPEVTFGVVATFHSATRQRRDVDNMLKLVLDGLNKVAWVDDNQVVEVTGRKQYVGRTAPAHTEVVVYRVGTIDRDKRTCPTCGEEFLVYESWTSKRQRMYCSRQCSVAARRKARIQVCEQCGVKFETHYVERVDLRHRFCSRGCSNAAGKTVIACKWCGKDFEQRKSWVENQPHCSVECQRAADAARRDARVSRMKGRCLVCGEGTTRREYKRCSACARARRPIPTQEAS